MLVKSIFPPYRCEIYLALSCFHPSALTAEYLPSLLRVLLFLGFLLLLLHQGAGRTWIKVLCAAWHMGQSPIFGRSRRDTKADHTARSVWTSFAVERSVPSACRLATDRPTNGDFWRTRDRRTERRYRSPPAPFYASLGFSTPLRGIYALWRARARAKGQQSCVATRRTYVRFLRSCPRFCGDFRAVP